MARLSAAQRRQFEEEGWVVVEGVLDPVADLQPVVDEYSAVLDRLATEMIESGALTSSYPDLPFVERVARISAETGRAYAQHFDISLPQSGVRADTPIHAGPAVFRLLTNPSLLDLVEDIVGPEITSNPVQHTRLKLPKWAIKEENPGGLVARIPWHQDNGVVLAEADDTDTLTVWLPVNEATLENGCLQVIPRSHREGLEPHCPTSEGLAIPSKLLPEERAMPLPMRPGCVLLMTQRTVHSSLDNMSAGVRWSFDLRYQVTGRPTGRPAFPPFVARSSAHPETVLHDSQAWAESWYAARAALAMIEDPAFNRWTADAAVCA